MYPSFAFTRAGAALDRQACVLLIFCAVVPRVVAGAPARATYPSCTEAVVFGQLENLTPWTTRPCAFFRLDRARLLEHRP